MAHERRGFKGGVAPTTLSGDITDTTTSITCTDLSTWVGVTSDGAATATIGGGQSDEEVVTFTAVSGNTLTGVVRGAAGTTAQTHTATDTVTHGGSVTDFDEANDLVAAFSNNSVRVSNSFAQPVGSGVLSTIGFDSTRWDTGGLKTSLTRLTCQTAGLYQIDVGVVWEANAAGYRQIVVLLNGTLIIANSLVPPIAFVEIAQSIHTQWRMSQGDYVELQLGQSSGGSLNVQPYGDYSPEFGMSFGGF